MDNIFWKLYNLMYQINKLTFSFCFSIGPDVAINVQFPELKDLITYKTLMSLEHELVPIVNIMYVFSL